MGLMVYETGKSEYPDAEGAVQSDTWTSELDGRQ